MTTVAIVVALVVVAVVVLLLMRRGPAQLQQGGLRRDRSGPPPRRRHKRRRPRAAPPSGPKPQRSPAQAPAAAKAPRRPCGGRRSPIGRAARPSAPGAPPAGRDVAGLRKGLAATRGGFIARLTALFQGKKEIDPAILEQVEEVMLASDVGPKTTQVDPRAPARVAREERAARRRRRVGRAARGGHAHPRHRRRAHPSPRPSPPSCSWSASTASARRRRSASSRPATTRQARRSCWPRATRSAPPPCSSSRCGASASGAEVVKGKEGADPGAVAFDATTKAKEAGADLLLVDTAGRLHTKVPLMDEIKKVRKTIAKAMDGAPHETLLVLDATTGQNALAQAAMFKEALDLTGIVLTKLDGTAKGGIVLGICDELAGSRPLHRAGRARGRPARVRRRGLRRSAVRQGGRGVCGSLIDQPTVSFWSFISLNDNSYVVPHFVMARSFGQQTHCSAEICA